MNRSQTDERLRYYLNARQADQERLVAEVLPQLGPYKACKVQRPQGGPDGGCDVVAELNDGRGNVVVAVGFKNDAGPAASDRPWAERKFRSDLGRAAEANVKAAGFVFVTNVDLTPARKERLKAEANQNGFSHADLFDREQLRLALDRPEGFFIRLRYLGIPMTAEEQYRMLATVGTELTQLTASVRAVETELQRISLHRALDSPIKSIGWSFWLDKSRRRPVGQHAVLIVWPGESECSPQFALSEEITLSKNGASSTNVVAWRPGMQRELSLMGGSVSGGDGKPAPMRISSTVDWPFKEHPTIYQIMRAGCRVFATERIARSVSSMVLAMNELTLVDSAVPSPWVFPATSQPRWSIDAPARFTGIQWDALAVSPRREIWDALSPRPPVGTHETTAP